MSLFLPVEPLIGVSTVPNQAGIAWSQESKKPRELGTKMAPSFD
jgi:hypothetical protein